MKYEKGKDFIKIYDKNQFNVKHILECGQVFCFKEIDNKYLVFPSDKFAEIIEREDCVFISTKDVDYFENWFDLKTDYEKIKIRLNKFNIMKDAINFGYGIRILNQDLFETLISFIISANNNIKRIKLILNNIREKLGKRICENIYSFPTYQELLKCDVDFFRSIGAGYRSEYLYKVLRQIDEEILDKLKNLSTIELRKKLIELYGVGPKVADCVLLFGYHRGDVFPVDTWIHQMYNSFYPPLENREKIRDNLVKQFKNDAGFAQQYLFYFQRSSIDK